MEGPLNVVVWGWDMERVKRVLAELLPECSGSVGETTVYPVTGGEEVKPYSNAFGRPELGRYVVVGSPVGSGVTVYGSEEFKKIIISALTATVPKY
ncbi:MAG: hypothetical protein HYT98_01845 [Candidatus Sungbacteria bacterium]|nr:hypothetical protein [Candidatus Sungbacteria bacterium]